MRYNNKKHDSIDWPPNSTTPTF